MHRHTLPPANSWKQQDLRAEGLHPKLALGDAMGVSHQPRAPLSRLPLLRWGAGQCSKSQAGLCSQHRLCLVLRVPGWQTPSLPEGEPQSPDGRTPMHSRISTLPTRAAQCRLRCPDTGPAHTPGWKSSRLACVLQPAAAHQRLPDQSATCRKPAQIWLSWACSPDAMAFRAPSQRKAQCHLLPVYWTAIAQHLG